MIVSKSDQYKKSGDYFLKGTITALFYYVIDVENGKR